MRHVRIGSNFDGERRESGVTSGWRRGESNASSRPAMRANAGDFDHRAFRRKTSRAAGGFERFSGGAAGRFADRAAMLADEEDHGVAAGVIVHAGDEGIAAFDAMNKAIVAQKIERAIDVIGAGRVRAAPGVR